jgi:hypothetical protein
MNPRIFNFIRRIKSVSRLTYLGIIITLLLVTTIIILVVLREEDWQLSPHVKPDYRLIEKIVVLSNEKRPKNKEEWPDIDIILPITVKDSAFLGWFFNSIEIFFPHYHEIILLVEKADAYILHGVVPHKQGRYKAIIVNNPFEPAEKIYDQKFGYLTQQVKFNPCF